VTFTPGDGSGVILETLAEAVVGLTPDWIRTVVYWEHVCT
jgi:hypothetical protein